MLVLRSAALLIALIVMSAPRTAVGQAQSQPGAIAPEHQDMAAKRAKEREKINNCQKQATEQKILPRDRPPIRYQLSRWHGRTKSAFRCRAGVSGIGGKTSEGERKGRHLPETGHRTKSPAPRSAAIRDQLPGPIVQPT